MFTNRSRRLNMERSLLECLPGIVADARRETGKLLRESSCGTHRIRLRGCEWVRPPRSRADPATAEPGGRLILGDGLCAMAALLADSRLRRGLRGGIDLIYADLPFDPVRPGDAARPRRDTTALATHLAAIVPRLCLMRELLANTGSIYVRPGRCAAPYVKLVLDELFGRDCGINDIVWTVAPEEAAGRQRFATAHEVLFFYRKNADVAIWNDVFQGARAGSRDPGEAGSPEEMPRVRCRDVWSDIDATGTGAGESPSRRPDALLERIVSASSTAGALVADFTAGSGATAIAAARLGRRWIACEADRMACADARRRLIVEGAGPFLRSSLSRVRVAGGAGASLRSCRLFPADRRWPAGGA